MLGLHMGKVPAPFDAPLSDTEAWLQKINRASVVANVERGLLSRPLARKIIEALDEIEKEAAKPGARRSVLYIEFEPKLLERCGAGASVLHAGRSSQDILATANAGMNRERLMALAETLTEVEKALLERADAEKDAIVPAYTNGVQAQPTFYGHTLMAHFQVFGRDIERIFECVARYASSPMGSTVLNGTGWNLDADRMAELLGFSGAPENAFDAGQCQGNDLPLEASQIIEGVMLHIEAFLADFMAQYGQVRPWILSVSQNGVYHSSAMPQKRNPGLINDCRRDAGLVFSAAQSVPVRMMNLPLGMADVRDTLVMASLFEDAAVVVRTFAGIAASLRVVRERALEEVNSDWTSSQEIADTLMREAGIDFRTGHRFASNFVGWARKEGKTPVTAAYEDFCRVWEAFASGTELPAAFPLTAEALRHAVDPALILSGRKTRGSASPEEVVRQIRAGEARLERWKERAALWAEAQKQAAGALDAALRAI